MKRTKRGGVVAIVIISVAILMILGPSGAQVAEVRVVAPVPGQSYRPGDVVDVILESDVAVESVDVAVAGRFVIDGESPEAVSVTLPDDYVGQATLRVRAKMFGGGTAGTAVDILIEPSVGDVIALIAPEEVRLRIGGAYHFNIDAVLSSGKRIPIQGASFLSVVSDAPQVAGVGLDLAAGRVNITGADYGATTVRATTPLGIIAQVRVIVGVPAIRGDLNWDGLVSDGDISTLMDALGRSANPEDPRDLNGDAVIDKLDLEVLKGLQCGTVPNAGMVPGGGSSTTDCLGEWSLPDGALLNSKKCVPSEKQWCVDGAPCDADWQKDGVCTFALRVALNVQDARLPDCVASSVDTYSVVKPNAADALNRPEDAANRTALLNALGAIGVPPINRSTYTDELQLRVPLKATTKGLTKGKKTIKLLVEGSGGIKDTDKLKLTCYPAPVV